MAESRESGALGGWRRDAATTRTSEAGSSWANIDGDAPGTATATLPMGPRGERASDIAPLPTAIPGPPRGDAPTPLFDAVASGWEHRRQDERVADRPRFETPAGRGRWAAVPDPRSATGPVPVQRPRDPNDPRELAPVGVVPPPPPTDGPHDDIARHRAGIAPVAGRAHGAAVPEQRSATGPVPVQRPRNPNGLRELAPVSVVPPPPPRGGSPEDELTRRAERRRRPLATPSEAGGRHALRQHDEELRPEFHEERDTPCTVAAAPPSDVLPRATRLLIQGAAQRRESQAP